ncbi:MAG: thiamine-phosphate kinase [Puniceicoccales bacterium]|jgi:thiamine-monophosphate kinase|nr:thiamine-phosphate kinase [Puniceicoccales bacterium]
MTPFTNDVAGSIAALGEVRLIEKIKSWLGEATSHYPRGIGDDCAILPATPFSGQRLVTTDSVIWQRHFDETVSPEDVGRKLINRNLSDIAAMGGTPADAVLSLVLGPDTSIEWLGRFFAGVAESCRLYQVELAGGDVAGVARGFFCGTLALTGFAEKPMLRLGAQVGDTLLVTGSLGGSLLGKHFSFVPRLAEGRWLAKHLGVRAGMDVTDGIAKDVPAMLPADSVAALNLSSIPVSVDAARMNDGQSPLAHALDDGEDYELLIAAETTSVPGLLQDWSVEFPKLTLTPIGVIAPAATPADVGKLVDSESGKPLGVEHRGYLHF